MGPLRELRTKKTAPRGSIKDEKDRASWSESGRYGSSQGIKDKKTAPRGFKDKKKTAPHGFKDKKKTAPRGSVKDEKDRATRIY